jgi:RNA-directed DNA polymerase
MSKPTEYQPEAVSERINRAGELLRRWGWVELSIGTERMLTALDQGVKGGKWFSRIDQVTPERTLKIAFGKVADNQGAPGVDPVTIPMFEAHRDDELQRLSEHLRDGTYRPQAIRRHYIPKPGSQEQRPLGIPTVRDRVVQTALRLVLEPIFEQEFAEHSYGVRPGRGCNDALRRVDDLLKAGYTYVVDADLKSYFDTIPHDGLMALVGQKVSDGRVLSLIEAFLQQGVLDGVREGTPERGSPQGAVISPLLSTIDLNPLDHRMAQEGVEMVRSADDFVIRCRSPEEAARALARVQTGTAAAGLSLHPTKTRIVHARETGFDFLGYRFDRGQRYPRAKSLKKLKDTIRAETKRTSGKCLRAIIATVNPTWRGWFGYFKHSDKTTFSTRDGGIRMRLRSILRKRQKKRGRGRGSDHQRWPNAFFADQGLYSVKTAHALACQPSSR